MTQRTQTSQHTHDASATARTQRISASADTAAAGQDDRKGILGQLSMPAILAAALTSATSFLFSSRLGLTGSLIGAAIGAVVSTTASQVYNAMISSSVEKIQDLTAHAHQRDDEQQTNVMSPVSKTLIRQEPSSAPGRTDAGTATGTRVAPQAMRDEVARRHATAVMRRTFAVAAVAALAALAVYGIIVHYATNGQGIGPTPESVTQPQTQTQEETPSQETPPAQEAQPAQPSATEGQTTASTSDEGTQTQTESTDGLTTTEETSTQPTDSSSTSTDQTTNEGSDTQTDPTGDGSQDAQAAQTEATSSSTSTTSATSGS